MNKTMSIRSLPDEVVAQIKSSTAIVSLVGVVLELLKNSLDAKATKIDVTVDFARGDCTVEDDGLGIAPSEFREDGGLGKLYSMCTLCFNGKYTNSRRYLEIPVRRTSSWPTWHFPCLSVGNVSSDYHLAPLCIPLA